MVRLLNGSSASPPSAADNKLKKNGVGFLTFICACAVSFLLGRLSQGSPALSSLMGTSTGQQQPLVSMVESLQKDVHQLLQGTKNTQQQGAGNNSPPARTTNKELAGSNNGNLQQEAMEKLKIPPERQDVMRTITTVDIRGLELCHSTLSRGFEPVFDSFIGTIFREPGFLPEEGGILDVGAQFAEQSCHYGSIHPHRKVFTIDPSPSNQEFANNTFAHLMPNMVLRNHGLGKEEGEIRSTGDFFNMNRGTLVPIHTVDSIFIEQGEKLAFAHIDVEGMELDVLQGAVKTIRADQPVFSTELRVHRDPNYTRALLNFVDNLGYDSYVVNEVCGFPFMDFRNVLNIPRALSSRLIHSDVFSLGLATETIFRVDSTTVFDLVLPCCAAYAACCPNGQTTRPRSGCCSEAAVLQFFREQPQAAGKLPAAYLDWNGAKRITEQRWKDLEERASIT